MNERRAQLQRIYSDFTAPLRTYINLNFPNITQDREDTLHDILEKVVKCFDLYDSRYALSTWIYRIARNHCLDILRKETGFKSSDSEVLETFPSPIQGPFEQVESAMERERLGTLLSRLPTDERQVLFLRYYEDMSYRDIATVMNRPVGTLKYMVHKAKGWMKDQWEADL